MQPRPRLAMINLRSGLGNKRLLGHPAAGREAIFFRNQSHLVSFSITGLVMVILPNTPPLAILDTNPESGRRRERARAEPKIGMVQRKRRQGNTFDGPEIVGWVQPTGGKAGSDGGLHPTYEEAVAFEHHRGVLPEHESTPKIRRFDRARNSENARTNPAGIGWQEIHNMFSIMRFDQKHKTNGHLTTWTDCGKRT